MYCWAVFSPMQRSPRHARWMSAGVGGRPGCGVLIDEVTMPAFTLATLGRIHCRAQALLIYTEFADTDCTRGCVRIGRLVWIKSGSGKWAAQPGARGPGCSAGSSTGPYPAYWSHTSVPRQGGSAYGGGLPPRKASGYCAPRPVQNSEMTPGGPPSS